MKRALCIWLPQWPRQRRAATERKPDTSYQTVRADRHGHATTRWHVGQSSVVESESHDLYADRLALVELAQWCQRFSPTVGLEDADPPEALLLDVSGLGPLFGGELALVCQVVRDFYLRGLVVRVALADTIGAAWALARYAIQAEPAQHPHPKGAGTRLRPPNASSGAAKIPIVVPPTQTLAAIAPLPLAALRIPDQTVSLLAELGMHCIGQVAALPRDALLARFGPVLLERLDQATGAAAEVIAVQKPPPELQCQWLLEHSTDRRATLDFVLEKLLTRVSAVLASRREGVLQLECWFDCQSGPAIRFWVGLYRPTASTSYLLELVHLQMESLRLTEPVVAVRVAAIATAALELEQQELFTGDKRASPRQLAALVDRLTSRLGHTAVLRAHLVPEAQPEHACRYAPAVGWASPTKSISHSVFRTGPSKRRKKSQPLAPTIPPPLHRPLCLFREPLELEVVSVAPEGPPSRLRWQGWDERVAQLWGPERIETGWWRGPCIRRDYYRVETTTGHRLWLFRQLQSGRWFLAGTFE